MFVFSNKIIIALFLFVCVFSFLNSQEVARQEGHCAFDEIHHSFLLQDEHYRNRIDRIDKEWMRYPEENFSGHKRLYTLPVVVHIIHNGGAENISDQVVLNGLEFLNEAFSNTGYYNPSTGVDVEIEFCLATRSPNGAQSSGINRVQSSYTEFNYSTEERLVKDLSRWDPSEYINIWVVREICSSSGCGVAGYAYFPSAHGTEIDGIVVESDFIGSSPSNSAVLVHEMGHYLGLYHTFQGGCLNNDCKADGDKICDTPPDNTVVRSDCSAMINSCASDSDDSSANNPFRETSLGGIGDQNDQFQNYMDYSKLDCFDRFTQGQKNRMHFVLENTRSSLLNSFGCQDPCVQRVLADFIADKVDVELGEIVNFTNQSIGSVNYTWLLDGVPFSNDANVSYTFNTEGVFKVVLEVLSDDIHCRASYDSVLIHVTCPVKAGFSFEQTNDLEITFTDQSENANDVKYLIYDRFGALVYQGTDRGFVVNFTAPGIYLIYLISTGEHCSDTVKYDITVFSQGSENCSNGLDDDGNGRVDCFDKDCICASECEDFYFKDCGEEACYSSSSGELDPILLWESEIDFYNSCPLIAGDIDADGKVEIIGGRTNGPAYALEGSAGNLKYSYNYNNPTDGSGGNALFDLNGDGRAEIVMWQDDKIRLYQYDGTILWETNRVFSRSDRYAQVYDVDYDGVAEIIFGSYIINALNGEVLLSGADELGKHPAYGASGLVYLADVLNDSDCSNCQGMELISGSKVFSIGLNSYSDPTQNELTLEREIQGFSDGFTVCSDLDLDGELEIIVTGIRLNDQASGIYVWNPRTATLELPFFKYNNTTAFGGRVSVSDTDLDGSMELFFMALTESGTELLKLNSNLLEIWRVPVYDQSSSSSISIFDFNGDGEKELILRGQNELFFINAQDGNVSHKFNCSSGTIVDNPIIGDFNNNGQVEVACICGGNTSNLANAGKIRLYGSRSNSWQGGRSIWNQHNYHITNVNDDLTIPRQVQSGVYLEDLAFNSFLEQYPLKKQLPDLSVSVDPDTVCIPLEDYAYVEVEWCLESGSTNGRVTYGSLLNGNPFGDSIEINETLSFHNLSEMDTCISEVIGLRYDQYSEGEWHYVLMNYNESHGSLDWTDGFPFDTFEECSYKNNIDSFFVRVLPPPPDLGPNIEICDNQVFEFRIPGYYDSIRWNDGTSDTVYTAFSEGLHWVEVLDFCGNVYRDSVRIAYHPLSKVSLGDDIVVCKGKEVSIGTNRDFDHYQWFPTDAFTCNDCPITLLQTDTSLTVTVLVSDEEGCYSSDSIRIEVADEISIDNNLRACEGDTILFHGQELVDSGFYIDTVSDSGFCDTIFSLDLKFFPKYNYLKEEELCEGDSIYVLGQWINSEGTYDVLYESNEGCDSLVVYHVEWETRDTIFLNEQICEGDSILFNNDWIHSSGRYELISQGRICDSVHVLNLNVRDTSRNVLNFELCEGDSIFVVDGWIRDSGTYSFLTTNQFGCDSQVIAVVSPVILGGEPIVEIDCASLESIAKVSIEDELNVEWSNGDTSEVTSYQSGDSAWVLIFQDISCGRKYVFELPELPDMNPTPNWKDSIALKGEPFIIDLGLDPEQWMAEWSPSVYFSCDTCLVTRLDYTEDVQLELLLIHKSGCEFIYFFDIDWQEQEHIYVPNSFSPNGDNVNDYWQVYTRDHVDIFLEGALFDRWGNEIKKWENVEDISWDGTFKNKPMNPSVFTYYFKYRTLDAKIHLIKGDVTLIK